MHSTPFHPRDNPRFNCTAFSCIVHECGGQPWRRSGHTFPTSSLRREMEARLNSVLQEFSRECFDLERNLRFPWELLLRCCSAQRSNSTTTPAGSFQIRKPVDFRPQCSLVSQGMWSSRRAACKPRKPYSACIVDLALLTGSSHRTIEIKLGDQQCQN